MRKVNKFTEKKKSRRDLLRENSSLKNEVEDLKRRSSEIFFNCLGFASELYKINQDHKLFEKDRINADFLKLVISNVEKSKIVPEKNTN